MSSQTLQVENPPLHQRGALEPGFLTWVSELVSAHRQRLVHYARRQGLDAEEALDCVQEAFMSFIASQSARNLEGVRDDSLKLLTVILRNIVSNRRRSVRRRAQYFESLEPEAGSNWETSSETLVSQAQNAAQLGMCIERLAELQRAVVRLVLLEGASSDETAAALNLTSVHVRVLVHRAREHLKTCSVYHQAELEV